MGCRAVWVFKCSFLAGLFNPPDSSLLTCLLLPVFTLWEGAALKDCQLQIQMEYTPPIAPIENLNLS